MDGVVAEEDVGELAATADLAGGASALKMDQENAAPDAGKQNLPPEGQNAKVNFGQLPLAYMVAGESDKAAGFDEQPELGGEDIRWGYADTAEARSARAHAPSR